MRKSASTKPVKTKPIVMYSTSILHGGCSSRLGMSYPAIMGRAIDQPIINLGVSGNGQAEPEIAELLNELDPSALLPQRQCQRNP